MPYQSVLVQKLIRFVPDDAPRVAGDLRRIAADARALAERIRGLNGSLEADWEGQAKERFLAEFGEQPPFGDSTAAWLEGEASRIEGLTVERWEAVYEEQWVPE